MESLGLQDADEVRGETLRSAGLVDLDRTRGVGPEWLSIAPPAALDALVRERLHRALEQKRQSLATEQDQRAAPPSNGPAASLPFVERWVYALGLIGYGAQVLGGFARFLWHR